MTWATVPGIMDMEYRYTAGQNNGRIAQSKDWTSGEEVTYTYDSLQRLASATTTGTQWGEAYSYDGFGNLTGKTPTQGSAPALSVVYNPATNQPYNGNYDANGNAPVGTWDIENRLVGQTLDGQAIAWGYDPSGKRVMRLQTVNGLPKWSFYLYDSGGRRLAQFGCAAGGGAYTYCAPYTVAAEGTETYFGGKLIASTDASGRLLGATDRLGTVRGVQTNGGTWAQPTYFPYGEPRTGGGIDGKEQFATYVRDSTASAQDYAGQRYYSNITARFFSPDPYRASASLTNPQTWNRYIYVHGDPVNFTDPGGMDEQCAATWCVTATGYSDSDSGPQGSAGPVFPNGPNSAMVAEMNTSETAAEPLAAAALSDSIMREEVFEGLIRASVALRDKPDCAGLFGLTGQSGNSSPGALAVLSMISNSFKFAPIASTTPGYVTSAITVGTGSTTVPIGNGATMQVNTGVVITLNNTALQTSFVSGTASDWATTILHELGHAYWDLYGQGTSKIQPDSDSAQTSVDNTNLIKKDCNP